MTQRDPDASSTPLDHRGVRIAIILLVALATILTGAVVADLLTETEPYQLGEGTTIDAFDGPKVVLGENVTSERRHPIVGDTINLEPAVSISGAAGSEATVAGLSATWVTLSDVDAPDGLSIETDDHGLLSITGSAEGVDYRDYSAVDGSHTLSVDGPDGSINLTLSNLDAGSDYVVVRDDGGSVVDIAAIDGGEATIEVEESAQLSIETDSVTIDDPAPADGAFVDNQTMTQLAADLEHPMLEADNSVNVSFNAGDDTLLDETVVSEAETVTGWHDELLLGANEWYVEVYDPVNDVTITSDTWTFDTPHNLTIVDEQTGEQLDDVDVEVQFFPDGEDDGTLTRNTTDGNVSLEGLPYDSEIVVRASADEYFTREAVIRDLTEQMTVYLLSESADSVEVDFRLEDATGDFPEGESRLLVNKPIEVDGETTYQNIIGQEFGVGGAQVWLEEDQRYRIEVESPDGERRSMGTFTPTIAATHELKIQSRDVSIAPPDHDLGFRWDVAFDEDDGVIELAYQDSEDLTDHLDIVIHERGNESNLLAEESHQSPTNLTATWSIPEDQDDVPAWTVAISGVYDGEDFSASNPVDIDLDVSLPIPDWLSGFASFVVVVLVGALFGAHRADLGAVVAASVAGLLYLIGFMPPGVSGLLVVSALLFALAYRHSTGGGGAHRG